MPKLGNKTLRLGIWFVVGIAALNWGLVEFVGTDLLTDVIALSGTNLTIAYAVIGAAGAVNLYNLVVGELMD